MTPDTVRRLAMLANQAAAALMTAAICHQEIHATVRAQLDDDVPSGPGRRDAMSASAMPREKQRPLLDESRLSVMWKGNVLHLGDTRGFWLLARLARHPNQYVTYLDLVTDVWDDAELKTATASIRSAVRRLRLKLKEGGMSDLAAAVRGHNERYILDL